MSKSKATALKERIEGVVKMLSSMDVPVRCMGMEAKVQWNSDGTPNTVFLPMISEETSPELIAAIEGFLDHEVAHILFTNNKKVQDWLSALSHKYDSRDAKRLKALENLLEDARIEKKMMERFKGSGKNLESVNKFHFESIVKSAIESGDQKMIKSSVYPALVRAMSGRTEMREMLEEAGVWGMCEQIMDEGGRENFESLKDIDAQEDVLRLAESIYEHIKEPPEPPSDKSDDDDPDGESEGSDDGDESESESESESKSSKPDSDEEEKEKEEEEGESDKSDGGDGKDDSESDSDEGSDDQSDSDSSEGGDSDSSESEGGEGGDSDDAEPEESEEKSASGGSGKGDSESESESDESPEKSSGDPSGESHGDGTAADKREESTEIPDSVDPSFLDDVPDLSEDIAEGIAKAAEEELGSQNYVVLTDSYDYIGKLKLSGEEERAVRDSPTMIKKYEEKVNSVSGALQKNLERIIRSRQQSRWNPGQKKGKLHAANLYRLKTGNPKVFRQRIKSDTIRETAVSLCVDLSGSMCGSKIAIAMQSASALAKALDRSGVPCEVIGFTTYYRGYKLGKKNWDSMIEVDKGIRQIERILKKSPSRMEPLFMPIFKGFDESYNPTTSRDMALYASSNVENLNENIDGESVEIAYKRLLTRREPNKLLIVLSDGSPAGRGEGSSKRKHLREVAEKIGNSDDVDIFAIGIEDGSVKSYYKEHTVIRNVQELPNKILDKVKSSVLK
jgi:cobalamin biosynthesis protein CobT